MTAPRDVSVASLLDQAAEKLLTLYPENASLMGLDRADRATLKARLTDRTPQGIAELSDYIDAVLVTLRAQDRAGLSQRTILDLDVVEGAYALVREGLRFGFGDITGLNMSLSHRSTPYAVAQNTGAYIEVPDFLDTQHRVIDSADAEGFIARLRSYAQALDGETERLRRDGDAGVVLPAFLLKKTIRQLATQRDTPSCKWGWLASFASKVAGFPRQPGMEASAVADKLIVPALNRQIDALTAQRGVATGDAGVWKLPDGEAFYDWALRAHTTTRTSAREIHRLGLEQLATLQARMEPLLRAQGLAHGTIGERLAALGRDPHNLFTNDDAGRGALLAYIDDCLVDIRARMPHAFATLVPCNMAVRRVPVAIEEGAPDGYASAGAIDGSVPGYYHINLRDTALWPRHALPTLTYHEAIPGHIWQGEYTYRLPLIRSLLSFNAYAEGWALYAEQLADELSVYEDDPLGELGYLQSLAFRACRLVVDTGLHAMRWTRDEAIAWFVENNGSSEQQVAGEVDRYCVWPAQCCSYKVGHSWIVGLRERAQQALGNAFELRHFNDMLVSHGSMPLNLLSRITDVFIAERRAT